MLSAAKPVFALTALVLLSILSTAAASGYATCSASGDPHWKTFDGCYHDFQANEGYYQVLKTDEINFQSFMQRCNPRARKPVSCVRASIVELSFGEAKIKISWGFQWHSPYYPASGSFAEQNATAAFEDPVVIQPFDRVEGVSNPTANGCTLNNDIWTCPRKAFVNKVYVLGGEWYIVLTNRGIKIVENGEAVPHHIHLGRVYYFVGLRRSAFSRQLSTGVTNGLCGHFNGDKAGEFTHSNGTDMWPNQQCPFRFTWYNKGGPCYEWGKSWLAHPTNSIDQLTIQGHHELMDYTLQNNGSDPLEYNDTEIAEMNEVEFDKTDEIDDTVEALCGQIVDEDMRQNCIMDAQALGEVDPINVAQNVEAALAVQADQLEAEKTASSHSDEMSSGAIAATTMGVVAGVALLVGIFLFVRLRKQRQKLSHALVLARSAGGTQSDSSYNLNTGDSAEIHVADNI